MLPFLLELTEGQAQLWRGDYYYRALHSLFKPAHHTEEKDVGCLNYCKCWKELRIVGEIVQKRLRLLCGLGGGPTIPRFTGTLGCGEARLLSWAHRDVRKAFWEADCASGCFQAAYQGICDRFRCSSRLSLVLSYLHWLSLLSDCREERCWFWYCCAANGDWKEISCHHRGRWEATGQPPLHLDEEEQCCPCGSQCRCLYKCLAEPCPERSNIRFGPQRAGQQRKSFNIDCWTIIVVLLLRQDYP